ncbi:hypothetical protein GY45DRAFT_1376337 [Cubamyces sp. BRFM 1775]|nr:hypothetical protein GY45DRAFT_1376337 [Cubamyces sp. BRFM 1775]
MSTNPRAYNVDDRLRWEQYADAFRAWLAKRGPYPGDPPAGYLEVYKAMQRRDGARRPLGNAVAAHIEAEEVAIGRREAADTVDQEPTDRLLNASGTTEDSEARREDVVTARHAVDRGVDASGQNPRPMKPDAVDHENEAVQPANSPDVETYDDPENPMVVDLELDQQVEARF